MLERILNFLIRRLRDRRIRSAIQVGTNSDVIGAIDKRSPRSRIKIGNDCLIHGTLVTETDDSEICIGNNVFIGGGTIVDCATRITIEDDVLISFSGLLVDSNSHSQSYSIRKHDLAAWKKGKKDWSTPSSAPIRISKGAWLGAHSIILKGVVIGEGAIVGAGAVVTADVPPWTVVAGNPARIVRKLAENEH
jgi:acetyltransferase-like isoleucine patch superfamily enzyme